MAPPIDRAGLARKEALHHAWTAVSAMTGRAVGERLGVTGKSFYAWTSRSNPHKPPAKALLVIAAVLKGWSRELASAAKELERVADKGE